MTALPVEHSHVLRVAELAPHHRDPFDRLLVAQAELEAATLVTADPSVRAPCRAKRRPRSNAFRHFSLPPGWRSQGGLFR